MTRQQRQLDELRALCADGRVARAVDLAFEHVAGFGADGEILDLLAAAADHHATPGPLRARLRELARLAGGTGAGSGPPPASER